jgi:membrane-bound serine protease (ClpP class)
MYLALAAILFGILLLALEVFIPSGGILMILSLFSLGAGVVMVFYAPASEGGGVTAGVITIVGLIMLLVVVGGMFLYFFPQTSMGKQYFLNQPTEEESAVTTEAEDAFVQLNGQIGKTVTQHQPSGAVEVKGRRYDSVTEGTFVDAGQWVRVVAVKGSQLIIRPVSERDLTDLPSDLNA